ncbi:MAG: Hsp20/alpha crystallin family protein [Methanoregula sp.]|nr:Hsp20/alpha crystallin family protein [Methanoregula sp.]
MQIEFLSGVDIFDEADRVQVIVDLPVVKEHDLSVDLEATALLISARAGDRYYHRHIDLGVPVKGTPDIHYNNGIFEIKIGKG